MSSKTFDWSGEINQVITKSLVTTFGLDFLLFEDKKGGDVDTIQNVRQGIWATEAEKTKYDNKGDYKPAVLGNDGNPIYDYNGKVKKKDIYHNNSEYRVRGKKDAELKKSGLLHDKYRDSTMSVSEDRQLDHIISASEIHHDAGRVLAEKDGIKLANADTNLTSTHSYINNIKRDHSPEKFFNEVVPQKINQEKNQLIKKQEKIKTLPVDTPEQKDVKRRLENEINDHKKNIETLESINKTKSLEIVDSARDAYEKEVNSYYSSSKFFKSSLKTAGVAGIKMGLRETLGLILAEIWFELQEVIPSIYAKYKKIEFKVKSFLDDLKYTFLNIIERVKQRFKNIVASFRDATISGFFASLSTTILNIFLTTTKFWGKLIRESWLNLIKVMKMAFFNPENLSTGELTKATFKILSASVGLIVGMLIHESLAALNSMPLGNLVVDFVSALTSGIVILALNYFIEQNEIMQKFWSHLDQLKTKYEKILDNIKEINKELDDYILQLTRLEFGLNIDEISKFTEQLTQVNSELERNIVLKKEVEKQEIKLPFEMGNSESTRSWLLRLAKK